MQSFCIPICGTQDSLRDQKKNTMTYEECRVDMDAGACVIQNQGQEQLASETTVLEESQVRGSTYKAIKDMDKKLLKEINDEISKPQGEMTSGGTEQDDDPDNNKKIKKIQKAPAVLQGRDGDSKQYFTPRFFSIGPVHARNTKLGKHELKCKLAARFIKASSQDSENLLGEINNNIDKLKTYFDDKVIQYDDDRLARIFFLDGCAILQFIYCVACDDYSDIEMNNGQVSLIKQDLFLLENQIPFLVLNLLMKSMRESKKFKGHIATFISMNLMEPEKYSPSGLPMKHWEENEPEHLLDLLRTALLYDVRRSKPNPTSKNTKYHERSFRNVQDLKAAGIKLKRSDTNSLKDISFEFGYFFTAYLKLPKFTVDESTGSKLLNLVAYEMCFDNSRTNHYGVTSYLNFLDLLIDNEQDVKDLRSAHILRNRLSSDVDVAELFNKIGTDLVPDDSYADVQNKIEEHYTRRCAPWMAQVCQDHFSSPWTMIALVAAVFAIFLTAIGTWFTIYPRD